MMTYNYLLFCFIIYSFAGWLLESTYRSIEERKLINSGFLYGPCCPIYSFGALFILLLFSEIKNPIYLFILGFIVLTAWEYLVGVILEKIFHTKYWDYSSEKININGRICLKNSIFWGILTVIFVKIIHPNILKMIYQIPGQILYYLNIVFYCILLIDVLISCMKIYSINSKIEKLKVIKKFIRFKLFKVRHETKNMLLDTKNVMYNNVDVEKLIEDYNKISLQVYKQLLGLIKAFPTMKSEKINKFLNNKLDITEIKIKINEIKNKLKKHKDKRK